MSKFKENQKTVITVERQLKIKIKKTKTQIVESLCRVKISAYCSINASSWHTQTIYSGNLGKIFCRGFKHDPKGQCGFENIREEHLHDSENLIIKG